MTKKRAFIAGALAFGLCVLFAWATHLYRAPLTYEEFTISIEEASKLDEFERAIASRSSAREHVDSRLSPERVHQAVRLNVGSVRFRGSGRQLPEAFAVKRVFAYDTPIDYYVNGDARKRVMLVIVHRDTLEVIGFVDEAGLWP
jgi:hypothetical protein